MTSTDIYRRDSDGDVVKLGTVKEDGGPALFEGLDAEFVAFLKRRAHVGLDDLDWRDGATFVGGLPFFLCGSRLWATDIT